MKPSEAWRLNWNDLKHIFVNRPVYLSEIFMTMALIALALWTILAGRAGAAWPVPLALCVAQCVWQARLSETRSLTPVLLWVAGGLVR
jgi:hypothetical protein